MRYYFGDLEVSEGEFYDWPIHRPECHDAPIPGRQWYGGCTGDRPRVNPATGRCVECGEAACPVCGRGNCPDHT